MQAKLTVMDRLIILNNIQKSGRINLMRTSKSIMKKLEITKEEVEKYNVVQAQGQIKFSEAAEKEPVEFDFAPSEVKQIRELFKSIEEKGQLALDGVGVYEIFCADQTSVEIAS